NRRKFIRISAAAGAGALLMPGAKAETTSVPAKQQASPLPMRTLGRTGLQVPILSMGVMRADNPNVVRAAYNSGITHFDTAHGYQNGRNEEMLGEFFKDKSRDTFTIATKCKIGYPYSATFEKEFSDMLDLSLKRLQMNYVDIFYAHDMQSPEQVKDPRLIATMKKFKADGKAKFLGFSMHNHKPEQIDAAIEAGIYDVILLSYNFKIENIQAIEAAMERGAKAGIGFVAMKAMTGGTTDAAGTNKVNGQACLRWAWRNENLITAIPGFTSFDLLDDCLAAANNPTLTDADRQYMAYASQEEGLFCQQCGQCTGQCPQGLPIPDMMRAYMYAYGYKHAQLSKATLEELNLPQDMCGNCDSCQVKCKAGFNVAAKIAAIAPVRDMPMDFLS
ncbi:aldo/keto reductase, partial [Parabacteroides sp. OttesenSCG-928-G21]|nr:aldo/keto reductase [Parabacteroides sp. OttesenSCG-928-G21]